MKVGTITYHRAVNYGAVLQTLALQKVLDKLEVENEVIDYRADYVEWIYKPFCMRDRKSIGDFFKIVKGASIKSKKRNQFFNFIKKNIRLSKKAYTNKTLDEANEVYDLFITGSDQVFNLDCSNYDTNYLLEFVKDNDKKASYAASFGFDEMPEKDVQEYQRLLSGFKNISVREACGVEIVKKAIGGKATEVLDPTLLISKDEWKEIVGNQKSSESGYILIYALMPSKTLIEFANKLQELTGLNIVFIKDSLTKEGINILNDNVKYLKDVEPLEFVKLIADAEYVITNSFHGTAFSINFNKKFFTELLAPETKVNSRLENILDMLDLRNRQLIDLDSLTLDDIDYDRVNSLLQERRDLSIGYLKNILAK